MSIILQYPRETRTKYLLRFPRMYQEFMNSSNVEKLKVLLYDTLTEDCVFHILTSPPIVGVRRIYDMLCSTLLSSPDFYVLVHDIKYSHRRHITCLATSFGTIPYVDSITTSETSYWNFTGMPLQQLDDFHQTQKQTYDRLISQKKTIKFKRVTRWHLYLNRQELKFKKSMAASTRLEIYEN